MKIDRFLANLPPSGRVCHLHPNAVLRILSRTISSKSRTIAVRTHPTGRIHWSRRHSMSKSPHNSRRNCAVGSPSLTENSKSIKTRTWFIQLMMTVAVTEKWILCRQKSFLVRTPVAIPSSVLLFGKKMRSILKSFRTMEATIFLHRDRTKKSILLAFSQ